MDCENSLAVYVKKIGEWIERCGVCLIKKAPSKNKDIHSQNGNLVFHLGK